MALNNPYALSFDGVDDYVKSQSLIPYSAVWSFECFFIAKRPPSTTRIEQILSNYSTFVFSWSHTNPAFVRSVLFLRNTTWYGAQIGRNLSTDTLYHLAATYDGTLKIYVNGALEVNVSIEVSPDASPYPLQIGAGIGGDGLPLSYFYGFVDEVRIWNRVLTQSEILNKMYKRLQGNEFGLIAYYRFDEGSGSIAYDASPNNLKGTIYGASWINGLIDLDVGAVMLSATAHGRATSTAKPLRARPVDATAYSHTVFTASNTIRLKGLRATAHGQAIGYARPQKIANARSIAHCRSTATATMLVLYIPPGVYSIDADNIFNRNQPLNPDSLANYIEVWVNPLKPVDVAEEVYKTDDPIPISANETKTVTIHYKKEPVTEVVISLLDAPAYATITNIRYYAWGADVTVTSPSTGTFRLVATGKPLEVQGRELVVKKDETSILENGIKKYTFDNPFVQDRTTAEMIAEKLLAFAVPQADIEIDWRGDPALVLADPVLIPTFQRQGLDQRGVFYVTKQELEYDGGLRAKLSARKMGGE